jgi:NADH dehydrogenase
VKVLAGKVRPYRYRSLGQGATLGRMKGIAYVSGVQLRGPLASMVIRWYHMSQVLQLSRAARIFADGLLSLVFGRDCVELTMSDYVPEARWRPVEQRAA